MGEWPNDVAGVDDGEWPRYILCDQTECPVTWRHWHFRNEDGTAAGSQWWPPPEGGPTAAERLRAVADGTADFTDLAPHTRPVVPETAVEFPSGSVVNFKRRYDP